MKRKQAAQPRSIPCRESFVAGAGSQIFVNGRFATQKLSGVQRCARELLIALDGLLSEGVIDRSRFRFILLQPRAVAQPGQYRYIEVRSIGRFTGHLWEQTTLLSHVRGELLLNLCNTAPLFKRNQVLTIHDAAVHAIPDAYTPAFRAWYRVMHSVVGARAARIVTVSEFSKRELVERLKLPAERIFVMSEGSDHVLRVPSEPAILERFGLNRRPFVLAVSNLAPHKNFQAIVRALEILGLHEVDIVIAGGANPQVFASDGTRLPELVKWVGHASDGELRALYEHAACFVYPSLYEGFGLPPLEAMTFGCPVLASTKGAVPEVCGDAALYCDPRSPVDIAAKLKELLADLALRERLRARGYARAASFTWRRSAEQLWHEVLLLLGELPSREKRDPHAHSACR